VMGSTEVAKIVLAREFGCADFVPRRPSAGNPTCQP
jgi:hypothetical protein